MAPPRLPTFTLSLVAPLISPPHDGFIAGGSLQIDMTALAFRRTSCLTSELATCVTVLGRSEDISKIAASVELQPESSITEQKSKGQERVSEGPDTEVSLRNKIFVNSGKEAVQEDPFAEQNALPYPSDGDAPKDFQVSACRENDEYSIDAVVSDNPVPVHTQKFTSGVSTGGGYVVVFQSHQDAARWKDSIHHTARTSSSLAESLVETLRAILEEPTAAEDIPTHVQPTEMPLIPSPGIVLGFSSVAALHAWAKRHQKTLKPFTIECRVAGNRRSQVALTGTAEVGVPASDGIAICSDGTRQLMDTAKATEKASSVHSSLPAALDAANRWVTMALAEWGEQQKTTKVKDWATCPSSNHDHAPLQATSSTASVNVGRKVDDGGCGQSSIISTGTVDVWGLRSWLPPPGVLLVENFVSEDEEQRLLDFFNDPQRVWIKKLKRRVQHYGYQFKYESLYIDSTPGAASPIPPELEPLIQRIDAAGGFDWSPDQLTVNEYQPGQGIGFHVDTHSAFTEAIIVVSLGSALNMEFRKPTPVPVGVEMPRAIKAETELPKICSKIADTSQSEISTATTALPPVQKLPLLDVREVHLPRRSLCIFANEARYAWLHGIKSRTTDLLPGGHGVSKRATRLSLTFRKLNWRSDFKCHDCGASHLCDTQNPVSLRLPERL